MSSEGDQCVFFVLEGSEEEECDEGYAGGGAAEDSGGSAADGSGEPDAVSGGDDSDASQISDGEQQDKDLSDQEMADIESSDYEKEHQKEIEELDGQLTEDNRKEDADDRDRATKAAIEEELRKERQKSDWEANVVHALERQGCRMIVFLPSGPRCVPAPPHRPNRPRPAKPARKSSHR